MGRRVFISGAFDNLRSSEVRMLEECARLGAVCVLLWSDAVCIKAEGKAPEFPELERRYLLESIRYVSQVLPLGELAGPGAFASTGDIWAVRNDHAARSVEADCRSCGIEYRVFADDALEGFPAATFDDAPASARRKVIVTGCYDWLHSGHVRFFEEVSTYGDLYVVLGTDANIRMLKGAGHPLFSQQERRYMVGAVRFVHQALIATGEGWLDAAPEIERLKPAIYAVNEDGDRGGKREYCAQHGIEYLVLKRQPAAGLRARSSTQLRGF